MSRSYQKTPRCGLTCATTEKRDKRFANRAYRRAVKVALHHGDELPLRREVTNVYCFDKDGKKWYGFIDPDILAKLLRK